MRQVRVEATSENSELICTPLQFAAGRCRKARSCTRQIVRIGRSTSLARLPRIGPVVELKHCQARCENGRTVCFGKEKGLIEHTEQRFPGI
jgi:hypothetical protein